MKILLFGGNGQVGWELQRSLAPLGRLIVLGRNGRDGLSGDLAQPEALRHTVRQLAPDIIVNAAAYTAVDLAESEPELAELVNAEAPGVLAEEALRQGTLLVHYSTDYIFDGSGNIPWREEDNPAPLNVYGATKWRGEQAVREVGALHFIFRTQWVYAARGGNFIRTMLRLAAERETLQVIDDQVGTPTSAELIADTTAHALHAVINSPELAGTYHLAARGETSWHGYASFIIETARRKGWPIKVPEGAIEPVGTDAFPTPAKRPLNSRLDTTKLESVFGLRMPEWQAGVERVLGEMVSG